MKKCPKCGELIGDNVIECFMCHFNFTYGRVITPEERFKEREKNEQKLQKKLELKQNFEKYKEEQLKRNPIYEYTTVVINDNVDGTADAKQIQNKLSEYSSAGWRLHSIFTNEVGKSSVGAFVGFFGGNLNATIDQTILIFERCIKE